VARRRPRENLCGALSLLADFEAHPKPTGGLRAPKRKRAAAASEKKKKKEKEQRQRPELRRCCIPFCHPGAEKAAFGKTPPDSFLAPVKSQTGELTLKCPAWTLSEGDQRYVIEHRGRVATVGTDGKVCGERRAETLRCWAEYSGPAQLIENHSKPASGYDNLPTRVSEIFMDPQAWGMSITDNDPCLFFGGGFNYTLCKQHSAVRLASLDAGSIVLFGSVGGPKNWQNTGDGKFYLDTVFVVGASAEVSSPSVAKEDDEGAKYSHVCIGEEEWSDFVGEQRIRAALEDRDVPAGTRTAWRQLFEAQAQVSSSAGQKQAAAAVAAHPGASELPSGRWPTKKSCGPEVGRVYTGVGFADRAEHDGMFSFVPSWRNKGLRQRPTLNLDALSELGMPRPNTKKSAGKPWSAALNGQLTGSAQHSLQPGQLQAIWQEVVAQVLKQDFELGCWFAPPPPAPPSVVEAVEAGVAMSEKAQFEFAESDMKRLHQGMQIVDGLWEQNPKAVWIIERVLYGPALRLRLKGGKVVRSKVSLVDRAQREALRPAK
jgi:hypothetical protein